MLIGHPVPGNVELVIRCHRHMATEAISLAVVTWCVCGGVPYMAGWQ